MNNDYTQITISLAAADLDAAAAIAHMAVPYGFYCEDYSHLEEEIAAIANTTLIDEELLAKDRTRGAIHLYIPVEEDPQEAVSFLRCRFEASEIPCEISLANCRAEDWENNWKAYYKPVNIGKKLTVVPQWLKEEHRADDSRLPLFIDPGLAFGTGNHATTRLCLELLEEVNLPSGASVLDIGCGSGILGVAALLFGAKNVRALDIDPVAVRKSAENAALNGFLPPAFTAQKATLDDCDDEQYHLILANIVANVLIPLAPKIAQCAGDFVVLGGIIELQEQEVAAAYQAHGLCLVRRVERDGWIGLLMRKQGCG